MARTDSKGFVDRMEEYVGKELLRRVENLFSFSRAEPATIEMSGPTTSGASSILYMPESLETGPLSLRELDAGRACTREDVEKAHDIIKNNRPKDREIDI